MTPIPNRKRRRFLSGARLPDASDPTLAAPAPVPPAFWEPTPDLRPQPESSPAMSSAASEQATQAFSLPNETPVNPSPARAPVATAPLPPVFEAPPDPVAPAAVDNVPPRGDTGAPTPPQEAVGPLTAIVRHPYLFTFILLVCAGAGAALALTRPPVYSAESRLAVGSIDVESQALPGYVSATQTLAGSYSRAVDSQRVIGPLAAARRTRPENIAARLAASPVPGSSVIRIEATGTTESTAVRLANDASASLVRYVRALAPSGARSELTLGEYRNAALEEGKAQRRRAELSGRYEAVQTPELRAALREAAANLSTARLRRSALAARYQSDLQRDPGANFVQELTTATSATSDWFPTLELYAFSGGAAGLVLGAAASTALANRRRRRAAGS